MKVDVNEVLAMAKRRREINSVSLKDIEWVDGKTPLVARAEDVEEFILTGLSNCDFVLFLYRSANDPAVLFAPMEGDRVRIIGGSAIGETGKLVLLRDDGSAVVEMDEPRAVMVVGNALEDLELEQQNTV